MILEVRLTIASEWVDLLKAAAEQGDVDAQLVLRKLRTCDRLRLVFSLFRWGALSEKCDDRIRRRRKSGGAMVSHGRRAGICQRRSRLWWPVSLARLDGQRHSFCLRGLHACVLQVFGRAQCVEGRCAHGSNDSAVSTQLVSSAMVTPSHGRRAGICRCAGQSGLHVFPYRYTHIGAKKNAVFSFCYQCVGSVFPRA